MSTMHHLPDFRMTIEHGRHARTSIVLSGELDIASVARVRKVFYALLDAEDAGQVDVSLGDLHFVDVPSVRLLAELAVVAARRDVALELAGASGQVARML